MCAHHSGRGQYGRSTEQRRSKRALAASADTEGRCYFEKRPAGGKTKHAAIRALKRQISDRVWTVLTSTPPDGSST
ncbi:MAG: hypothetical protein ACI83Y_002458 [Candidatus Azotimanducaceae bacterium]|jgi:hypothetical protein